MFKTGKGRFNYRVGAIIIHNGRILMVKNNRAPYFYSVGGRVKFDDTCDEAVKREVKEELGVDLEIDRPVFLHELFFDEGTTKEHFHEVSIYFLMKTPENVEKIICASVDERGSREELCWIQIEKFGGYEAYPNFFATELMRLPTSLKRIVEIRNR